MAGVWRKTLVYLGLVEDDELDEYAYEEHEVEEEPRRRHSRRSSQAPAARDPIEDYAPKREAVVRSIPTQPQARFHLVNPTQFKADAQEVGDKFREGFSVLMNLHAAEGRERQRLIDFASGLAYGMGGSIQPAGENVILITPPGVQVSAEERQRFLEERGFFNQA
ncbi:MAG TPA: cell division protein SepF [Actinomycetota bacterium]|nr:cell division protein SepF [Actinomycetota bacterium]